MVIDIVLIVANHNKIWEFFASTDVDKIYTFDIFFKLCVYTLNIITQK